MRIEHDDDGSVDVYVPNHFGPPPVAEPLLRSMIADALAGPTDECIEWPMSRFSNGYGQLRFASMKMGAHRAACLLAHGEPPAPDLDAAHSCRMKHCVNPRHLSWETRVENQADRLRDGTDARGERNPAARFTDEQVAAIRHQISQGRRGKDIAAEYGVRQSTISGIKCYRHYAGASCA